MAVLDFVHYETRYSSVCKTLGPQAGAFEPSVAERLSLSQPNLLPLWDPLLVLVAQCVHADAARDTADVSVYGLRSHLDAMAPCASRAKAA